MSFYTQDVSTGRELIVSPTQPIAQVARTITSDADRDALRRSIASSALLANATNVGMGESADQSPVPASLLMPDTAVFDAIYHPLKTRLLMDAEKAGCLTANGLPMLIGQAAASFEFWTGRPMPLKSLPSLP